MTKQMWIIKSNHGRQLRNASLRSNFWLSVTIQSFLAFLPVLESFIFRTPIQLVLIKKKKKSWFLLWPLCIISSLFWATVRNLYSAKAPSLCVMDRGSRVGMESKAHVPVSLPSKHGYFNELSDMSEVTCIWKFFPIKNTQKITMFNCNNSLIITNLAKVLSSTFLSENLNSFFIIWKQFFMLFKRTDLIRCINGKVTII